MAGELDSEQGGTVEAFGTQIPTQPATLTIPQRTIQVDVYYVTNEQLEEIQNASRESGERLGFWTFATGVVVSLGGTLVTTVDDFAPKHPRAFSFLTIVCVVAFFWGISQFVSWRTTRKKLHFIIGNIKKAPK